MRLVSKLTAGTQLIGMPLILILFFGGGAWGDDEQPWSVRPIYTISVAPYALDYDETRGEFRVRIASPEKGPMEQEILATSDGYRIELEDGKSLTPTTMGLGKTSRDEYKGPQGTGTSYTLSVPAKDGIEIIHRAVSFDQWPFVVMRMTVKNVGDQAVAIKRLSPAVFGPGALKLWSPDTKVTAKHCAFRGAYPVYNRKAPADLIFFHEPSRRISLAMGILPMGAGAAGADFVVSGAECQGHLSNSYTPARVLAPGASLQSDPIWISHGVPSPQQVESYYAWALSVLPRSEGHDDAPRAWAAVSDEGSLKDLVRQAQDLSSCGVSHALLPASWEGRPGSLQGASPRFPKNIAQAAKALRDAGVTPGITLDPLAIQGGKGAWTAKSADGQTWINPTLPGGKAAIADRIKKLSRAGFAFFVIEPSTIPESALKQFGLSMGEAEWSLFEAVAQGAGKAPVLPAAEDILPPQRDAWLQAAGAASRMGRYSIPIAALRLDAKGMKALDEESIAALRLWPAPVEIIGTPSSAGKKSLAKAIAGSRLLAFPVDAQERIPLVWQITQEEDDDQECIGVAVVTFRGAKAWKLDHLALDMKAKPIVWQASDGAFIDVVNKPAPQSEELSIYGVIPEQTHPTFMGVVNDSALHLNTLKDIRWDPGAARLSGVFNGATVSTGLVYIVAPAPWKAKSAKVGGKSAKPRVTGKRIALPLNGASSFEVTFKK